MVREIKMEITVGGWNTRVGQNPTGSWRSFRPVVSADLCTGCGICTDLCPEAAITISEGLAVVDYDHCKGCGICYTECRFDAVEYIPEPTE
ncbi:MAG: 4Fe-4S binding protein [Candidatus Bathyarchaeia archaeon]